jgi:hypothetical protein
VERQSEFSGKVACECEISIRFIAAQTVVKMGSVKDQAKFGGARSQRAKQGNGVSAARQAHSETQTRLEKRGVERERGQRSPGTIVRSLWSDVSSVVLTHLKMIRRSSGTLPGNMA